MGGAAAGEVAGGRGVGGRRRPLGSGLSGLHWPLDQEEEIGGGGGPAVMVGRPAEGEAALGAEPPVGGASLLEN